MTDPVEKVQKALDELHYDGRIIHSDATIFTVDDASKAIGVTPGEILKSLIFMIDGQPWLVLMSGPNKAHSGKIKRLSKGHHVTMASPDYVFENFGFRIGGVPPVGYPQALPALLDEDLWNYAIVWAAAGTDHAFFPVAPETLRKYTRGQKAAVKKEPPPQA
ncbi:YbaK/EbsC family protein [Pyramidobacter piscolens]|uniref:YbaK/EbsC family protein n=1 Tax=Pyramidobacter piscolens TaxID=638849 RepID=UPI002AB289A1|nr:YbaK/EbsC family protein [Pyramidobacter piscolens]